MLREVANAAETRAAEAERMCKQLQAEVETLQAKSAGLRTASDLELQLKEVGFVVRSAHVTLAKHGRHACEDHNLATHETPAIYLPQATELLYLKQSQLERLAGEKAAAQLQLEREMAVVRAEGIRRREASEKLSISYDAGGYDVVPMDTLGGFQKLANHQRVGDAFKAGAR